MRRAPRPVGAGDLLTHLAERSADVLARVLGALGDVFEPGFDVVPLLLHLVPLVTQLCLQQMRAHAQLAAALQKDVVLLLGREDVDRSDPDLRKTPEADEQGPNRFARGLTMFKHASETADALGVELRWQLAIVDGASHSNAQMAQAAATFVE